MADCQTFDLGNLALRGGAALRGAWLACRTYGRLNAVGGFAGQCRAGWGGSRMGESGSGRELRAVDVGGKVGGKGAVRGKGFGQDSVC